jgi:hypothetical protein
MDVRLKLAASFPKYAAGLEAMRNKAKARLDAKRRQALEIEPSKRTTEQRRLAEDAEFEIEPWLEDMLAAAAQETKDRLTELNEKYLAAKQRFDDIDRLDSLSKYAYWKIRCQVEATTEARQAKSLLYRAKKMAEQALLSEVREPDGTATPGAKELFEQAWEKWAYVFEHNPAMYDNVEESQMLIFDLIEYDKVLTKLELPPLPHDFALRRLIDTDSGVWTQGGGRPLQPKPEEVQDDDSAKPASTESPPPAVQPDAAKPAESEPPDQKPPDQKPADDKTELEQTGDSRSGSAPGSEAKPETEP